MAIVTVKNKYQVVIPQAIREKLGIVRGDVLEAKVERSRLTYTPKTVIDRIPVDKTERERFFKQLRDEAPDWLKETWVASKRRVLISSLCGRSTRRFQQPVASVRILNNPTGESGCIG